MVFREPLLPTFTEAKSLVAVNAKCTDWPDYAHENDRELLEDDSVPDLAENQTVSDAAEGSVIRANATVHIDREGSVNFRRRVQ